MKKTTCLLLLGVLGLTLAGPATAQTQTNPAQQNAQKRSHKARKKSSKQTQKQQKKNRKARNRAMKQWKKQHHVGNKGPSPAQ